MRMQHLNKNVPLYEVDEYPLITKWAEKLLALDSVSNSSPEDFDMIYDRFIQRRGKDGWLGKKCA
jgi:hypothetical protein